MFYDSHLLLLRYSGLQCEYSLEHETILITLGEETVAIIIKKK